MTPLPISYFELETIYTQTVAQGVKSLAVTASTEREGVSTVAYSLAKRCEAGGRRTLLVDLNLSRPSVASRLALAPSSWSLGDKSAQDAIVRFPGSLTAVLTASVQVATSIRSRERDYVSQSIADWLAEFDTVIVDAPAVNSSDHKHIPAETVCAACDATVLVVLAGRVAEASIKSAATRLSGAGARLAGSVFNDQFNPRLPDELCRETRRLDGILPGLMARVRKMIRRSDLLSYPV